MARHSSNHPQRWSPCAANCPRRVTLHGAHTSSHPQPHTGLLVSFTVSYAVEASMCCVANGEELWWLATGCAVSAVANLTAILRRRSVVHTEVPCVQHTCAVVH